MRTLLGARHLGWLLAAVPVSLFSASTSTPTPTSKDLDFFETKIRPILATQCYACHSTSQMGGLRLDSLEAILKGGKSGPAVVPGDPDKSLMIQAVRQTGNLKMPMGGRLKPEQVKDLETWVKDGAVWPAKEAKAAVHNVDGGNYTFTPEQLKFWSFQPLHAPAIPEVKDKKWVKTDIDRFVLARLEKEKLAPVRPADKRTLLRRATLDLTGLPPTPAEFEAFEKDKSPDAFAKVVDRLLASPQYGERWGRMWLDVARYGEDDYRSLAPAGRGYMPYQFAYLYRDWVIRALNNDMPYSQFIKAQLAADLMETNDRARMLPALGFLGLGPWYYDNGAVEITRADERNDRVDAIGRGLLGLTVGCARCHNHKYDPIPQKDYYSMAGIFASCEYHEYAMAPEKAVDEYTAEEKTVKAKEDLLREVLSNESEQLAETLAFESSKYMQAAWQVTGQPKDSIEKVVDGQKLDYELLDRWIHFLAKPPKFYPYLEKWQAMVQRGGSPAEAKKLADQFQSLLTEVMFEKREMKETNEIIVDKSLPGLKRRKGRPQLPNEFKTNDDFCPGCDLELKSLPLQKMNLWTDVFQRDLNEGEDPVQSFGRFKPGLLVFRGWSLEKRLSAERQAYVAALRADAEKSRKALPQHFPYVHGVHELDKPVDLKVSLRGSPYNLGQLAPRGFLEVLNGGKPDHFDKGSGRLELADAIIKEPIAMRVIVNRVWKWHFGTGIVNTPSNFGVVGERPTDPELLEFLAKYFVDHGMSLKSLHREIMLSSVYQLSSAYSKADFEKDSGNRLYWRFNRQRMDAEQIRDSLLAVAGDLDKKLGGPSQPLTPSDTRRTVYGKVSRYRLDEYLQLFDFPSPSQTAEQRFSTNVPLQRLFFMNSDFVQQQAELLAKRVASEPTNKARIEEAYQIVFNRDPSPDELQTGLQYLRAEPMREYEESKADSEKKDGRKHDHSRAGPETAASTEGQGAGGQAAGADGAPPAEIDPSGMLAGMFPSSKRRAGGKSVDKPLLPVTVWGRYAKILLSSSEFEYID